MSMSALPPSSSAKRPAPFSLRLSEAERSRLAVEAAGAPLGAYIRAKVLGGEIPARFRRSGLCVEDRTALAKALGLLGQSRMASNLNQLALAVHTGSLLLPPTLEADLQAATRAVVEIRALLLRALGLRDGARTGDDAEGGP